jgi:hypothetical protein
MADSLCERSRECGRVADWQISGGKRSCTTHLGKMALAHGTSTVTILRVPR